MLKVLIIARSKLCHLFSPFFVNIVYGFSFNDVVLVQPVRFTESHQTFDMMRVPLEFSGNKVGFFAPFPN